MKKNLLLVALLFIYSDLFAQDEISLFNYDGEAVAYINSEEGMLLGLQRRQLQYTHNMSHIRDIRSLNPTKVTANTPHINPILVALGAQ